MSHVILNEWRYNNFFLFLFLSKRNLTETWLTWRTTHRDRQESSTGPTAQFIKDINIQIVESWSKNSFYSFCCCCCLLVCLFVCFLVCVCLFLRYFPVYFNRDELNWVLWCSHNPSVHTDEIAHVGRINHSVTESKWIELNKKYVRTLKKNIKKRREKKKTKKETNQTMAAVLLFEHTNILNTHLGMSTALPLRLS